MDPRDLGLVLMFFGTVLTLGVNLHTDAAIEAERVPLEQHDTGLDAAAEEVEEDEAPAYEPLEDEDEEGGSASSGGGGGGGGDDGGGIHGASASSRPCVRSENAATIPAFSNRRKCKPKKGGPFGLLLSSLQIGE